MRPQSMCLSSVAGAGVPGVEKTEEVKDGGKSAESDNSGSQQSGLTGKDVRGGVCSYICLYLFFAHIITSSVFSDIHFVLPG